EKKLTVPSMTWIDRLRTESEGGNIYSVPLVAGTEYTFEFSRNLTDSLGGILPHLSFYDPDNSLLSLDAAQEIEVETAAYPAANPSIICYTFTPTVSGHYIVRLADGEPYSGRYLDDSGNLQTFTPEADKGVVLFIYKERRNEANETGYYTNFYLEDNSGNKTESISVNDLIEMRKLFIEANMAYFNEVYGQNLEDDDYGNGNSFEITMLDTAKERFDSYVEQVLGKIGLTYDYKDFEDYLTNAELTSIDKALSADVSVDIIADYLEKILKDKNALDDTGNLKKEVKGIVSVPNSAVSTSSLLDEYADIPTDITGIPYEDRYSLGRGLMAHTFLDPTGGVHIKLDKAYEFSRQGLINKFLEATSADSGITTNVPKASDTQAIHPIRTNFHTDFVKTSSQAETLSKSGANVSLATSALGLSFGTGSTSNFKFGLTSMTFIIHYEETEVKYRELDDDEIEAAWKKGMLFEAMDLYESRDIDYVRQFRNDFGDYYVSAHQYGACFDAYVSITTQTSEQLKEVETKLGASLTLNNIKASADISSKTQDILKKNQAKISVNIVTNGFGTQVPTPVKLPVSTDITAMDSVFSELLKFRNQIGGGNRANYAPVRVKMNRWRSHIKVFLTMRKHGDKSGAVPITLRQQGKISSFNTRLRDLRAYQNVVVDIPGISQHTQGIREEFTKLVNFVSGAGYKVYRDEYQASFDKTAEEVNVLTDKFNALADRYVFYTKLVIAQKDEQEYYDPRKRQADAAGEGTDVAYEMVRNMPFGPNGGSSGYAEFNTSNYVKADIAAGKRDKKKVHIDRSGTGDQWRIEWTEQDVQEDLRMIQYGYRNTSARLEASATNTDGTAANAVFCFVRAGSTHADSKDDRARWLTRGSPAVGTKYVGFLFRSGFSSSVDWEIEGQAMRMDPNDYPFSGLTTEH
ncbi:MAG: hypothetical protein SPL10_04515, partial [Synergistales bacterium]|nr:hypothetical protein [Synergistales bacterium]MDY6405116.1 hypothetical protein [Synergistales bacterium]MDY6409843.1 hypothetical protein [Synergistales bacterium]MDY6414405.1 hypothetical protein [Synergistales bacterium]MDY6428669.1 hypothetical protein [Synergistales bacterium]